MRKIRIFENLWQALKGTRPLPEADTRLSAQEIDVRAEDLLNWLALRRLSTQETTNVILKARDITLGLDTLRRPERPVEVLCLHLFEKKLKNVPTDQHHAVLEATARMLRQMIGRFPFEEIWNSWSLELGPAPDLVDGGEGGAIPCAG